MSEVDNKEIIIVGVTGGIGAYKACEVIRGFQKNGYDVWVTTTPNAEKFVGKITFEALTGHPVNADLFDSEISPYAHVTLGMKASAMVVVPCTANTLAKIAHGIADNALTSTVLALKAPLFIAPAMNENMFLNPATQKNIKKCENFRIHFIEPVEGHLACGIHGNGKLEEVDVIVEKVCNFIEGK